MSITDIVANIDQRLAVLEAELAQLTDARGALLERSRPAVAPEPVRRARAATSGPSRRRTRPGRTRDVVPAGKLVALLSTSPGMRTRELSEATNGDAGQVLTLLKEQEQAGQVRRSGSRASTRWYAVTDEDRIAARVAELEASSRRARQTAG